jgi:hypothetical protein
MDQSKWPSCNHCGHPTHGWAKCAAPGITVEFGTVRVNGVLQSCVESYSQACVCTPVVLEGTVDK